MTELGRIAAALQADLDKERTIPASVQLQALARRIFLEDPEGRLFFALLRVRLGEGTPIVTEQDRAAHNLLLEIKELVGWGNTVDWFKEEIDMTYSRVVKRDPETYEERKATNG